MNRKSLEILAEALKKMEKGFAALPELPNNYDYSAISRGNPGSGGQDAGQLPLFSPFLCRADAEAAASRGPHGLYAQPLDQSQ